MEAFGGLILKNRSSHFHLRLFFLTSSMRTPEINIFLLPAPSHEMRSHYWDNPSLSTKPQGCHTIYGHTLWLLMYNFLLFLFSSSLALPPFPPLSFQQIVNAVLVFTIQPAWVFISSCHILAASIISHCKAIWVLITGGVHRPGDPSTCLTYSTHANAAVWASSAIRVNATSLQCIMRWYSRSIL